VMQVPLGYQHQCCQASLADSAAYMQSEGQTSVQMVM
jgi:hypothetical protein